MSIAITAAVLAMCVAIALLLQTVAAVVLVTLIAVAELARTYTTLRQARRQLSRDARETRANNSP